MAEPADKVHAPRPRQDESVHRGEQRHDALERRRDLSGYDSLLNGRAAGPRPIQTAPNRTGLPDRLKNGLEALSGLSMDGVKVHHGSARPAQLHAHAFTQGTDIHVAPGQGRHLPHEAWHVVQQAQGRVKPTLQMKGGVPVNDDPSLEREADAMAPLLARVTAPAVMPRRGPLPRTNAVVQGVFVDVTVKEAMNISDRFSDDPDLAGAIMAMARAPAPAQTLEDWTCTLPTSQGEMLKSRLVEPAPSPLAAAAESSTGVRGGRKDPEAKKAPGPPKPTARTLSQPSGVAASAAAAAAATGPASAAVDTSKPTAGPRGKKNKFDHYANVSKAEIKKLIAEASKTVQFASVRQSGTGTPVIKSRHPRIVPAEEQHLNHLATAVLSQTVSSGFKEVEHQVLKLTDKNVYLLGANNPDSSRNLYGQTFESVVGGSSHDTVGQSPSAKKLSNRRLDKARAEMSANPALAATRIKDFAPAAAASALVAAARSGQPAAIAIDRDLNKSGNTPHSHAELDTLLVFYEARKLDPEAIGGALIGGTKRPCNICWLALSFAKEMLELPIEFSDHPGLQFFDGTLDTFVILLNKALDDHKVLRSEVLTWVHGKQATYRSHVTKGPGKGETDVRTDSEPEEDSEGEEEVPKPRAAAASISTGAHVRKRPKQD